MTLATYIHSQSMIHRISPGYKILALLVSSTALFLLNDWREVALALLIIAVLYRVATIPARIAVVQLRPALWLFGLIFAFQFVVSGWELATLVTLRFVDLLLMASLVTLTTPVSAMIDSMERGLFWLKWVGVNPAKIGLAVSLSLRFIPVVAEITAEVKEAQMARGLEWSIVAVALPVIIRTLKMADDVADAIEARSYDP